MNFNGNQTYRTVVGAILSISMVTFIGFYAIVSIMRLVLNGNPDFVVNTVLKDMYVDYNAPFNATENNFEFSVAFLSIRPYKFIEVDPRFVQIEMRRIDMDSTGEEIIFTKHPSEFGPCDPEKNFIKD